MKIECQCRGVGEPERSLRKPAKGMGLFDFGLGDSEKNARAEAIFHGRDALDDQSLWEKYFKQYGVEETTVSRVRKVLSGVLQTDLSRIHDSDDFSKELAFFWDWDSMADVEAVQALESEFGIAITDSEAEAMKTLKDIVLGIHEKLGRKTG